MASENADGSDHGDRMDQAGLQLDGETEAKVEAVNAAQPTDSEARRKRFELAALNFGTEPYIIREIEDLRQTNMPAALFLGVPTAGKTWLLQRIKAKLDRNWTCEPPLALGKAKITSEKVGEIDQKNAAEAVKLAAPERSNLTAEEILAAQERIGAADVGRTGAYIVHRFLKMKNRSFALIDVPGERVERLIAEEYSQIRGLMAAIEYASVIILALPADSVLLGKKIGDDDAGLSSGIPQTMLDDAESVAKIAGAIGSIAAVRSLMKSKNLQIFWKEDGDPADDYDTHITPRNRRNHFISNEMLPIGGEDGTGCPAFVALTKSDRVLATIDSLPDPAGISEARKRKFAMANNDLNITTEGRILQDLFQNSEMNPKNSDDEKTKLAAIQELWSGKSEPLLNISNIPELIRKIQPKLFNTLTEHLPMVRFDMVSAFYGNTATTLQMSDLERMESVGVDELIEWLSAVNNRRITTWHGWAAKVFRRIYPLDADSPFGDGETRQVSTSKLLKPAPPSLLKPMFRKEWHVTQALPIALTLLAGCAALFGCINPIEKTNRYANVVNYENFKNSLRPETAGGKSVVQIEALASLPEPAFRSVAIAAAATDPIAGLSNWKQVGETGPYVVTKIAAAPAASEDPSLPQAEFSRMQQAVYDLEQSREVWVNDYVCTTNGWGDFRPIVRLAVINGYGDCSALTRIALRVPAIEMLGMVGGLAALLLGLALTVGLGIYARWFHQTRRAYAWLYHSRSATTRRKPPPNTPGAAEADAAPEPAA